MIEKRGKKEKERSHFHVSISIFINKSGTECGPLSLFSRVPSLPHTLAGWLAHGQTQVLYIGAATPGGVLHIVVGLAKD